MSLDIDLRALIGGPAGHHRNYLWTLGGAGVTGVFVANEEFSTVNVDKVRTSVDHLMNSPSSALPSFRSPTFATCCRSVTSVEWL